MSALERETRNVEAAGIGREERNRQPSLDSQPGSMKLSHWPRSDDRRPIRDGKLSERGPLRNHQFAALRFLESHGLVESDDSALRHFIRRRLSGDALQPKAGSGH
jgi:hypothetical protein